MSISSKSLHGMTGLRAIACLTVMAYHLNQHRTVENLSALSWSLYQFVETLPSVVVVFFLLSGALHSLPFWNAVREGNPLPSFKSYALDRFFRIAPAFYVSLTASFFVAFLLGNLWSAPFARFLSGLFFISGWHPVTFFPVEGNGPLWFASFEVFGYVLIALFMAALSKLKGFFRVGAFLFFSALLLGFHSWFIALPFPKIDGVVWDWFPYYNAFAFGMYFLFGTAVWYVFSHFAPNGKGSVWFDVAFSVLMMITVDFLFLISPLGDFDVSFPKSPYHFPFVAILLSLSMLVLPYGKYLGKLLDNVLFAFIAKISFSLYLFHALIIGLLCRFVFWTQNLSTVHWLGLVTATFALSVPLAMLSYKFIEMPAMAWRKKRWN